MIVKTTDRPRPTNPGRAAGQQVLNSSFKVLISAMCLLWMDSNQRQGPFGSFLEPRVSKGESEDRLCVLGDLPPYDLLSHCRLVGSLSPLYTVSPTDINDMSPLGIIWCHLSSKTKPSIDSLHKESLTLGYIIFVDSNG